MTSRTDQANRLIKAPAAAIYRAMTDAAALVIWLPPTGMTGEMVHFDPTPGGRYRMILRYDDVTIAGKAGGNQDVVEARFIELTPDRSVTQTADFVSDDPRFAGTMTMRWLLQPEGDATRVDIIATDVPEGISAKDHAEGMNASLANLAAFVEPT